MERISTHLDARGPTPRAIDRTSERAHRSLIFVNDMAGARDDDDVISRRRRDDSGGSIGEDDDGTRARGRTRDRARVMMRATTTVTDATTTRTVVTRDV